MRHILLLPFPNSIQVKRKFGIQKNWHSHTRRLKARQHNWNEIFQNIRRISITTNSANNVCVVTKQTHNENILNNVEQLVFS